MLVWSSVGQMESSWPMSTVRAMADGGPRSLTGYRGVAAELGWLGLMVTEGQGGGSPSGNGVADAALIAAERGARLQPGPFVGHAVVVDTLGRTGDQRHSSVLSELVDGRSWSTWAFAESTGLRAEPFADGPRLSGRIQSVADAADCGWLLVQSSSGDGLLQVLLPIDVQGLAVRPSKGLDVTRRWFDLEFDGVPAKGNLLARPGTAAEMAFARQAQVAAVLIAADAVGAMQSDFDLALRYSKERIAFGRPIGSFQAIKHLLADTSLWLEMSKGLVAEAADALGRGDPRGPELAHATKAFVAERGVELAHNCFQVFGGIGYTWDHDQHLHLRRITADSISYGSAAWHRERLLRAAGV